MPMDPVFVEGQKIICRGPRGYELSAGKEYEVIAYTPRTSSSGPYIWPAYVRIRDDRGKLVTAHARRFESI